MKSLLLSLSVASFVGQAFSWKAEGHLLIARMAYDKLQSESPAVLAKVNDELKALASDSPDLTSSESDYPFVECSTFADELRSKGGNWQEDWHFVDQPYIDVSGKSIDDYPDFKFNEQNVTLVIPGLVDWLSNTDGYKDSYAYTTIMGHADSEEVGRSYAIRFLIHYVGDIHQPLHSSSRVNDDYPQGDRGGNSFDLPNRQKDSNLHAVWDAVVYKFGESFKLPFTSSKWDELEGYASDLNSQYTIDTKDEQDTNVNHWAQQSFALVEGVYGGITEDEALPESYISKNQPLAEKQLVLGGMRLAYLLKSIYGDSDASNGQDDCDSDSFLQ